jgi:hypothetical protein
MAVLVRMFVDQQQTTQAQPQDSSSFRIRLVGERDHINPADANVIVLWSRKTHILPEFAVSWTAPAES